MRYYIAVTVFGIIYFLGSYKLFRGFFAHEYQNDPVLAWPEFGAYLVYFIALVFFAHVSASFYFNRASDKKKVTLDGQEPETPGKVIEVVDGSGDVGADIEANVGARLKQKR